jgi:hypothetical protein
MRSFLRLTLIFPVVLLLSACASSGSGDQAKSEDGAAEPATVANPAFGTTTPVARTMAAPRAGAAASSPRSAAADEKVDEPLDQAEANGKCWMKVDQKTSMSLEDKAKFVGKCTDEMMAADRIKWAGKPKN